MRQAAGAGVNYDPLHALAVPVNLTWLTPSPHARQRSTFEGYMLRLADPGVEYDAVWLRCARQPAQTSSQPSSPANTQVTNFRFKSIWSTAYGVTPAWLPASPENNSNVLPSPL